MKKLFTLLLALVATTALWSESFEVDGLYYRKSTKDGVMSVIADTTGWNIPAECLTVAEAREICSQLEDGATTGTKYYVKGWVKKLTSQHEAGISQFGNALFYIVDSKDNTEEDFYAYQVYGLNGKKITNPDAVAVGDYVVIYGELTNYNGTYETVGKGAAHIWKSTNPALSGGNTPGTDTPIEVVGDGTMENPYTANDVLLLNNSNAGNYWVKAHIVGQVSSYSLSGSSEFDAPFTSGTNADGEPTGYMTNVLIADAADESTPDNCVPVQLPAGAVRTGVNLVQNPKNDGLEILLYGSLETYFGVTGVKSTQYAKIGDKEFGVNPNVVQKEPTAKVVTIAEFLAAPESPEVYYELTGVISGLSAGGNAVVYGNFDLSDETGTVYVYGLTKEFIAVGTTSNDKSFASLGLKDGDKITIRGFRGSYAGKIEVYGAYFVKLISSGNENPTPGTTGPTPEGAIVFDADVDKGNAGTDSNNATSFTITKNGVTITVSSGILGTYNNEAHYRIYKNQTLTVTSTVGNVKKVTFTCTANDDAKYGPGCFTWSTGDYTYSGANGTWTGDASEIVFTASSNQVRVIELSVVLGDGSIATYTNKIQQSEGLEQDTTNYVVVTYQNQNSNNYAGLTNINIPSEVEYKGVIYKVIGIGYDAFANNNSISSIVIPGNIKNIGDHAFKGSNISSIYFESSTPPVISSITFDGIYQNNLHFYVPCGSIEAYQSVFNLQVEEYPAIYHMQLLSSENGYAYMLKNTLCEAQIEAIANRGYKFVQWSDGNADNPRTLELTQDTILTAEFAVSYSGQCGDNLYWAYDEDCKKISITGSGDMYDYTKSTQPWYLFQEQITEVTTSNTTTSIGASAFEGCIRLGKVSLGYGMGNIAANAFAECKRLYDIYVYASYPPFAEESSFANYNVYLYVPCENQRDYILDVVWGEFKFIECIGAESDETGGDDVTVTPGSNDVTITWPTEDEAETYSIVITKDGEVFCTLTFNSNGQLLNIAFAPGREGNHPAQYAEAAANGYRFTVTGLDKGTKYAYNLDVKDSTDKTIKSYEGEFTTQSTTAVDEIQSTTNNVEKIFLDGQLLIIRDGKTYNAQGAAL